MGEPFQPRRSFSPYGAEAFTLMSLSGARRWASARRRTGCRESGSSMTHNNGNDVPDDEPMQTLIGKQLRSLYESVLAEPLPDNIVDLLVKLDEVPVSQGNNNAKPDPDQE